MLFIMNMILLMMISMMMFFFSMIFFLNNNMLLMEWTIFHLNSLDFNMFIMIDWMSLLFSSLVLLISSMIYLYCFSYMSLEKFKNRFNYLLMMFIMSMNLMIFSPNLLSIMLGWDGLGIISFCLIIYYQNSLSFKGGMLTILCNRLGDVGLLMAITLMLTFGSWNMLYYSDLIFLMVSLGAISKSAQMPFSLWLPAAMAAPTPISSLVHSSTLVTAGVYLLIRYSMMLKINHNLLMILFFLSLITLIISSMMAMFEFDLKKIIALSTLSQLSLMMMSLSIGIWKLTFLHLISHALFKSLLFLCAGLMIHSMNNFQDIRFYGGLLYMYPMTMFMFMTSSLSLGGFPFLAGFYSKDLILENMFFISNNLIWMIFLFSCILTLSYSLRLFYHLFMGNMNLLNLNYNNENKIMFYSMNFLLSMSMMGGSLLYWMYFLNTKLSFPSNLIKNLIISMLIMSMMMYLMYHTFNFLKQFKYFYLLKFIFNMMNLSNFFNMIYLPYLNHALMYNKLLEKGWLDMTINKMTFNLMLSTMFNIKFSFSSFILFLLIMITVSIIASFL